MPTGQPEGGNPSLGSPFPRVTPVCAELAKANLDKPLPKSKLLRTENSSQKRPLQCWKSTGQCGRGSDGFHLVYMCSDCGKISPVGTNPESFRLSLRISLILKKIWPWTELGPTGSNQELFLYLTRTRKTEISSH